MFDGDGTKTVLVILFDVFVEGESLIQDDTKVQDVGAGEKSGAMSGEEEVVGGFGVRLGSDDDRTLFQWGAEMMALVDYLSNRKNVGERAED